MKRRPLIALLLIAAALALAACGDDDDERGNLNVETGAETGGATGTTPTATTETAPTGPAATTIRVRETDFELDPKNPRIAEAGIVAFRVRNEGGTTHALEVEGPGGEQETDSIAPGGSASLRVNFDRPGRYTWYCPIADHESRGMKGVITVGAGGGGARGSDDGGSGTSGGDRSGSGGSDDRGGSGGGGSGY